MDRQMGNVGPLNLLIAWFLFQKILFKCIFIVYLEMGLRRMVVAATGLLYKHESSLESLVFLHLV